MTNIRSQSSKEELELGFENLLTQLKVVEDPQQRAELIEKLVTIVSSFQDSERILGAAKPDEIFAIQMEMNQIW